jgi:hypothetical protein
MTANVAFMMTLSCDAVRFGCALSFAYRSMTAKEFRTPRHTA